jgi:hypothetical protein
MNCIPDLPVEILVGGNLTDIQCQPLPPFSDESIRFLAELSKRLLKKPDSRTYPDIAGFAYWIRKANLVRIKRDQLESNYRIGRGLVFHIAPANVPVNFAFSLVFGLLAGNANIVRIPGVYHPQAAIICEEMSKLLKQAEHKRIAAMTRVIKYPRQDEVTEALSRACHARVLWGGDRTITHLRGMTTLPRCVDICFTDRYSICILDAKAILGSDSIGLNALVSGFYNDIFFLDQNACSSPHLVLWQGVDSDVYTAKSLFWSAMKIYLNNKDVPPPIHAIDKYTHLCRIAIQMDGIVFNSEQSNHIYRVSLDSLPQDIENYRGQYGFFFEATDNDLKVLESIVGERYQTITYFGIDPNKIIDRIIKNSMMGIDRIVPIGKALDIGVIWDGYDIIGMLSRIISKQ